eukprot:3201-Amphidinium_carterae.1
MHHPGDTCTKSTYNHSPRIAEDKHFQVHAHSLNSMGSARYAAQRHTHARTQASTSAVELRSGSSGSLDSEDLVLTRHGCTSCANQAHVRNDTSAASTTAH